MNTAKVELKTDNVKQLIKIISPELEKQISKRSKTTLESKGKRLIINVVSSDTNALRAALNNILRLVRAIEKAQKIR